jgi:Flp pilus assembly protein TadG
MKPGWIIFAIGWYSACVLIDGFARASEAIGAITARFFAVKCASCGSFVVVRSMRLAASYQKTSVQNWKHRGNVTVSGRRGEAGQVLVLAAVALTVLMLAAGLGIDMGYLRYQRRRMQTAADSAAIAAATQLGGDYQDAATTDASLNGFSSSNGATISPTVVTCPDGTVNGCAQVQVSQPQQVFFMNILGNKLSPVVSTVATAEQVPGLGCAYALSNANDAVMIGYGYHTLVTGSTCAFVDNGGLNFDSQSHTLLVESVAIGGPYNGSGNNSIPPPVITSVAAGDPFATLVAPSAPPPCSAQSLAYQPGVFVYPCGLMIDPSGPIPLTLNAGLYTVGGAGLTIGAGGHGTVLGTGVTFYVASGAVNINSTGTLWPSGYNYGTQVELQAPLDSSSGGFPGVVLFQDRTDTQPANIALWGDSGPSDGSFLWGAIYTPSATLTLTGMGYDNADSTIDECSATPRFTTVVALQLVLHQNINFSTNDCNVPYASVSTPVTSPNRNAVLVR